MSNPLTPPPTAAVFGGGIAGLTAAHELADRGIEVTVYEASGQLGGLARSSYATAPPPGQTMKRTSLQPEDCTIAMAVGGKDNSILVAGSAGIGVWYAPTGRFLRVLSPNSQPLLPTEVRALSMDAAGERLVYASFDDQVPRVVDVRETGVVWDLLNLHNAPVTMVASSPNGRWILTGDADGVVGRWERGLLVYTEGPPLTVGTPAAILSGDIADDGSGSWVQKDTLVLLSAAGTPTVEPGTVNATVIAGNRTAVVFAGGAVETRSDDPAQPDIQYLGNASQGEVTVAASSSAGTLIGTGSTGGTVSIWREAEPAKPLWIFHLETPIESLVLTDEFAYVASRREGTYPHRIWQIDIAAGEIVREFEPPDTNMIAGEHGFRFFPSFYRHVTDTMQRIPDTASHRRTVADNLTSTDRQGVALNDGFRTHVFHRKFDLSIEEVFNFLQQTLVALGYNMRDVALFSLKTFQFLTSGPKRRRDYEAMSWWDYVEGPRYSPRFQRYLDDLPKVLVALDSRRADARTQGLVFVQLLQDQVSRGGDTDRTLNGPSSEAWFDKWQAWLERLGVKFRFHERLDHLALKEGAGLVADAIEHAVVDDGSGTSKPVKANFMVMAVPARGARMVMEETEIHNSWWRPCGDMWRLRHFPVKVSFGPISGIQFFLRNEAKILRGHVIYPDSPWALSSISQDQFWDAERRLRMRRDFDVRGQISAVVGAWDAPVPPAPSPLPAGWEHSAVVGKTAKDITDTDEFAAEVWRQLRMALNGRMAHPIRELTPRGNLPEPLYYHLESFPLGPEEGYLLNLIGDWDKRPGTLQDNGLYKYDVAFGKFVAAGNHMKTHTRLSTMESANESARHAVNSLLDQVGFREDGATIYPLEDWELLEARDFKDLDDILYDAGKPHFLEILSAFETVSGMFPCDPDANINRTEIPGAEPGALQSLLECTGVSATELACGLGITVEQLVAADRHLRNNPEVGSSWGPGIVGPELPPGFEPWPFDRAPASPTTTALARRLAEIFEAEVDRSEWSAARRIFHRLDTDHDDKIHREVAAAIADFVRDARERRPILDAVPLEELVSALVGGHEGFEGFVRRIDEEHERDLPSVALLETILRWIALQDGDDALRQLRDGPDARGHRYASGRRDPNVVRHGDVPDLTGHSAPVTANEARGATHTLLSQILSPSPFSFLFRK
jgi:15-cis-phytoene desaturase